MSPTLHEPVELTGGRVPAHVPGAYPRLSCCGGSQRVIRATAAVHYHASDQPMAHTEAHAHPADNETADHDYTEGWILAAEHAFGKAADKPLAEGRSTDYYRGYNESAERMSGGHKGRYGKDDVLLSRVTVEQLVDLLTELGVVTVAGQQLTPIGQAAANILPHLKLALAGEG